LSADYGAGLVYTEMESCESLYYKSKATQQDLKDTHLDKQTEGDTKLALQIFGGKKDIILKSVPLFEERGNYDFLDFNCGCPVPKVIRQNAGSSWLNRPDELVDLMKELVKISSKPVIIKIRIGFSNIIDIVSLCKQLEAVGVQAIAVHGRTRSEFFSGPVHYDVIADIKKNLTIPVIANGGINSENFQDIFAKTDADALMIGTKALGYPKVFENMCRIEQGLEPKKDSLEQQIIDLKKHIEYIYSIKDERQASGIMRSVSVHYMKGFENVKKYRLALVHCESKQDYLDVLSNMQNEQ
jgi:nifR3 family TIM-barrel protein